MITDGGVADNGKYWPSAREPGVHGRTLGTERLAVERLVWKSLSFVGKPCLGDVGKLKRLNPIFMSNMWDGCRFFENSSRIADVWKFELYRITRFALLSSRFSKCSTSLWYRIWVVGSRTLKIIEDWSIAWFGLAICARKTCARCHVEPAWSGRRCWKCVRPEWLFLEIEHIFNEFWKFSGTLE